MRRTTIALVLLFALRGVAAAAPERPYTRNVAVVLYDGVEVLDFGGPAEIFEVAGQLGAQGHEPAFHVYTVASSKKPITSQGFLRVVPEYAAADAPKPDILVLPGGRTGELIHDRAMMRWLAAAMDDGRTLAVCSGAAAAVATGRLDGQTITTFYGLVDRLDRRNPKVHVVHGRRFIDGGKVVTTAGVSAGIDGALHLVARTLGLDVAMRTAQHIEYRWTPEPYLLDSYPLLNPRLDERGRTLQLADRRLRTGKAAAAVATYRRALAGHGGDADVWYRLGKALAAQKKWGAAARAFRHAARDKAIAARAHYNTACVLARKGDRKRALASLRRAVAAGFRDASWMAADSDLASLRQSAGFKAILGSLRSER